MINKELICARGLTTNKKKNLFMDTCKGDSGGPILCKETGKKNLKNSYFISLIQIKGVKGEFKLSGIVSGGEGDCGTGKRSFYSARVF